MSKNNSKWDQHWIKTTKNKSKSTKTSQKDQNGAAKTTKNQIQTDTTLTKNDQKWAKTTHNVSKRSKTTNNTEVIIKVYFWKLFL